MRLKLLKNLLINLFIMDLSKFKIEKPKFQVLDKAYLLRGVAVHEIIITDIVSLYSEEYKTVEFEYRCCFYRHHENFREDILFRTKEEILQVISKQLNELS